MKCPHCNNDFEPNFNTTWNSNPEKKNAYSIYHQVCPSCHEVIIGIFEYKPETYPEYQTIMENLKLLKTQ